MPITTYAELKTNIADFLNRDDLTSVSSTFVSLAEADLNRQIRHWRQEKRSTAELTRNIAQYPQICSKLYDFTSQAEIHAHLS